MDLIRDISVSPVAPSALATIEQVREWCGVSDMSQDALLSRLSAMAVAQMENYCGALFTPRNVVETVEILDTFDTLMLAHAPITSVASVTIDGAAFASTEYRLNARFGFLRKVDASAWEKGLVIITYAAGYATVPAELVHASLELVKAVRDRREVAYGKARIAVPDVADETFFKTMDDALTGPNGASVPAHVAGLLAPYVRRFTP